MSQPRKFHLFNCDNIYELSVVEDLLNAAKAKLGFKFSVDKHIFTLSEMTELSTKTIPEMKMDFAIFVVHAHESVLFINNDNLEYGYAKVYRALMAATGGNVIVVIGGDDHYKDETEEEQSVISRWAWRRIAHSQFKEEFIDGRKSFVFSWNKKHRAIHEEALLHYFDPSKKGQKFEYKPSQEPPGQTVTLESNAVDEDPVQQLCSRVSCLEMDKEMGSKTEAKPKEFNGKDKIKMTQPGSASEPESIRLKGKAVQQPPGKLPSQNDQTQEQGVDDNAERHGENSSNTEIKRETLEMPVTWGEGAESKSKDDQELTIEELPPDVLVDFDYCFVLEKPEADNTEVGRGTNTTDDETLLMKTRLRYGQISYSRDDQVVWNEQWTPPDQLLIDLASKFKNVAVADVEIYHENQPGAIRVIISEAADNSVIYAMIDIVDDVITWIIDNVRHYISQLAVGSQPKLTEPKEVDHPS